MLLIKEGVPCRRGLWKHFLVDAHGQQVNSHKQWRSHDIGETSGPLSLLDDVRFQKTMCSEMPDSFAIVLNLARFSLDQPSHEDPDIQRSGYCEMFTALAQSETTTSCSHYQSDSDPVLIPPGCAVVSQLINTTRPLSILIETRVIICLTPPRAAPRWLAMLAIAESSPLGQRPPILLRTSSCCIACAITQALLKEGQWALVL